MVDTESVGAAKASARCGAHLSLLRAMVMIAENRGIRLIAEGIETIEQLATLRALDCRHGQGFLFSRPLPAAELERLVENDWQRAGDAAMTVTG